MSTRSTNVAAQAHEAEDTTAPEPRHPRVDGDSRHAQPRLHASALAPGLLRPPRLRPAVERGGERHASWFELFFDLVFVVAVAQLARELEANPSAWGFFRFAALLVPVWWAWVVYTWYADRFDTDDVVYRLLMIVAMFAITVMSVNLQGAGRDGDTGFVVTYLGVRAAALVLYLRAARPVPIARRIARSYGTASAVAACLWLTSLALPAPQRYAFWAAAVIAEFAAPLVSWRTVRATPINVSHIPERLGLFTIIVIGESVVAVAAGLSDAHWSVATVAVAAGVFFIAACLWWLYFDFVDPTWISQGFRVSQVYIYGHLPIVVGLTAVGAGAQLAIAHATEPALAAGTRWALSGGVVLYLLATTIIRLVANGFVRAQLPPYLLLAAVVAILIALAVGGGALPPAWLVLAQFTALAFMIGRKLLYTAPVVNPVGLRSNAGAFPAAEGYHSLPTRSVDGPEAPQQSLIADSR